MSHNKLSKYLAYREIIKRLLLIVGLWPSEQPSLLCRLFLYTHLVLSLSTVLAMIGYVQMHFTNVAAVTKGMGIMTSFVTVILKITWMYINRKCVSELHEMLDPHFTELLSKPQLSRIVLNGVTTFQRLSWILTMFICITCGIYVITPLVFIIYQHLHQIQPIKYILVYPGVYPWDIPPNGLLYKLHYICESTPNIALVCVTAGVDSLFTLHVFQMIGQLREMSYRIMHIDVKNDHKSVVRECIMQHETLMKCRDIIEKIYGPMILWIMITNAVILCSIIFQFTQIRSISIGRGIMFSTYMILKLTQTLMYAWAGTCLTEESKNYQTAVYTAEWLTNKNCMTSVLIMLTQKPLILTACNFSVVSIDVFIMVLNTTASYFFLLRTIHYED